MCWVSQQHTQTIMSTADKSEAVKMEVLESHKAHLLASRNKQKYYQVACEHAKEEVHCVPLPFLVEKYSGPCSFEEKIHCSFHYAQQLHYSTDPLQPGPIYFTTEMLIAWICCRAYTASSEVPCQ